MTIIRKFKSDDNLVGNKGASLHKVWTWRGVVEEDSHHGGFELTIIAVEPRQLVFVY